MITANTNEIPPKKKKTGYEDPTAYITNGVPITQILQPSQFMKVAGGTYLAGMISGTYNQTTGPMVSP